MINVEKLDRELKAAGIAVSGCNADGVVWGSDGSTEIQDRPEVKVVIAAHTPEVYTLKPETQVILANGKHEAVVECGVSGIDPLPETDVITINGEAQEIDLEQGRAEIKLTSSVAGTVIGIEYHGLFAVVKAEG